MKKTALNRESAAPSRPPSAAGPVLRSTQDSQDAPRRWRQQLAADQVEVCQRKETEGARQVLGDPAVAHLGEAPQALDHVERVLAARPGARPRPIDRPPAYGQRLVRAGGPSIHPIAHARGLEGLPIRGLPIRLVSIEDTLLPLPQR